MNNEPKSDDDVFGLGQSGTATFDPNSHGYRNHVVFKIGDNEILTLAADTVIRLGEWAKERNGKYS